MSSILKIGYFSGGSKYTLKPFFTLLDSRHLLKIVCTKTLKPSGRKKKTFSNLLYENAYEAKIEVVSLNDFKKPDIIEKIKSLNLDVVVVFSFGILLPKEILEIPKHGCINIHDSLLPKWRGASPVQHSLMNNEKETGFTFIIMNEGLDEGNILLTEKLKISNDDNYESLLNKIVEAASEKLVETIENLSFNKVNSYIQDHEKASYCYRIEKKDTYISFNNTADSVLGKIRAFSPSPGAKFYLKGELVKVLEAKIENNQLYYKNYGTILDNNMLIACKQGAIRPTKIQREGKRVMEIKQVLNGWNIQEGLIINEK